MARTRWARGAEHLNRRLAVAGVVSLLAGIGTAVGALVSALRAHPAEVTSPH
jgi:hypothetical protein